jgi:hypothetical protein
MLYHITDQFDLVAFALAGSQHLPLSTLSKTTNMEKGQSV